MRMLVLRRQYYYYYYYYCDTVRRGITTATTTTTTNYYHHHHRSSSYYCRHRPFVYSNQCSISTGGLDPHRRRHHPEERKDDDDGGVVPWFFRRLLRRQLQQQQRYYYSNSSTTTSTPTTKTKVQSGAAATLFATVPVGTSVVQAYQDLTTRGLLSSDEKQLSVLKVLQSLQDSLQGYIPPITRQMGDADADGESFLSRFFGGSSSNNTQKSPSTTTSTKQSPPPPRGVYVHGGPGCGKSLCMDLFYHCIQPSSSSMDGTTVGGGGTKRRVHFNEFMLDVHQRMYRLKKKQQDNNQESVVSTVASELVQEGWLLCFDEMQITDIADAMIVQRVVGEMLSMGAVCVITSNRPPSDLYKNGLQRELFLPFITELEHNCKIVRVESQTDYRLLAAGAGGVGTTGEVDGPSTYFQLDDPLEDGNSNAKEEMDQIFTTLCNGKMPQPTTVQTRSGRKVQVPLAAKGVARFTFDELCCRPLGAADYLVLAKAFHTILVDNITQMYHHEHYNEARRFIQFIDQLYEQKTKLICTSTVPPNQLYIAKETDIGDASLVRDEQFAFDRCISRLMEMQSEAYLSAPHLPTTTTTTTAEEDYLRFEVVKLTPEGLRRMFEKYDLDRNEILDRQEIQLLLEDITEAKDGHRNVVKEAIDSIFDIMDLDHSGGIDWTEFQSYCQEYGLDRQVEYK